MTAPAAIMGDYCDLKFIKSRAVAQVIVEIPIEQSAAFVAAFGTPSQSTGVPVAIARIDPKAASDPPKPAAKPSERERKKWSQLRPAQQAAMRCNEAAFQKFITGKVANGGNVGYTVEDAVRIACGVSSRADILDGSFAARKWADLDREYQAWLRV